MLPRKTLTEEPSEAASNELKGCEVMSAGQSRSRGGEDCTYTERLDGQDHRHRDQVKREEGVDRDGDCVESLLGLGTVAEGENDLQR